MPKTPHLCLLASVASAFVALAAFAQQTGKEYQAADKAKSAEPILKNLKPGTTHQHVMMPMRDGVKLATEVFLPPGPGPWPALLVRTPYGRFSLDGYAKRIADDDVAFVTQDPRGDGDSEGPPPADPVNNEGEMSDGYDCVEWIARQKWCNGRVGMFGGSGHGTCARMAFLAKPPHLVVVAAANTAGNTYLHWSFENGVRRWLYQWLTHRNARLSEWPKPTLYRYDMARWRQILAEAAKDNKAVLFTDDGWFNIFGDATLDEFEAFGQTCKVFATVSAKAHGKLDGLKFPSAPMPKLDPVPPFVEILKGAEVRAKSRLVYHVMGDVHDPPRGEARLYGGKTAPGNCHRVTHVWPVPHTPTPFYLHEDGGLRPTPPTDASAALTYPHDPKNPAPTLGGGFSYSPEGNGALDQRPLRGRKDILRFVSEPLTQPLEVVGKLWAELHASTDAPDTAFIVKLVDIYPDGYEALIREAAFMARYWQGLDSPAPLEKGKTYLLRFPLNSAAIAFNQGHRLGVFITSSSSPAYEVHPNTYEPVMSYDRSPVANNTVHTSAKYASRIILPVPVP
ncbi:MAG: CocE/NonD family hydrolase [Planctomycetes bacterium]|nr:CocE/NonD family hydrolase [Planctomycetota bacterium]MBM4086290.1 CocE/NonD family hydrolase [Planctomycetota bacterium]